jgi:transposase
MSLAGEAIATVDGRWRACGLYRSTFGADRWHRASGEEAIVSQATRRTALESSGLVHPHPEAVTAALFNTGNPFFFSRDKVQVKYEMLRAHVVGGLSVTAAAAEHGYSRAGFYLVDAGFEQRGMAGLLDERPGRKGPTKLSDDISVFLRRAPSTMSGAELSREVEARFGVSLHRRTVERARRR